MISRETVNGKAATVAYIDDNWNLVDADVATRAKVIFDDGEILFLRKPPEVGTKAADVDYIQNPDTGKFEGSRPHAHADDALDTYADDSIPPIDKVDRVNDIYTLTNKAVIDQVPAGPPNKVLVQDVAKQIAARSKALLQRFLGVSSVTWKTHNEETDAFLAKVLAVDLRDALLTKRASDTWYSDAQKEALEIAASKHPEIATDQDMRFVFIASMSITSQGEIVDSSSRLTNLAYKRFMDSNPDPAKRRFPTDLKTKSPDINGNFTKINKLLDQGKSLREVREIFDRQYTVRELEEMGWKISGYGKDDVVYGSAILGPKIGQGFYQNLNGNYKPLTTDIWFMRAWGRLTGSGIEATQEWDRIKERVRDALKAKGLRAPLDDDELYQVALEEHDKWEDRFKKWRDTHATGPKKPELAHATERYLYWYGGAMKEQPTSNKERPWMTAVFDRALRILAKEGIHLELAAAQATWWTPEQLLYKHLGGTVKHTGRNYAQALKDLFANED